MISAIYMVLLYRPLEGKKRFKEPVAEDNISREKIIFKISLKFA